LSKSFFKTLQGASIQRTPIMQDYEEHPSCNLVKNTTCMLTKTSSGRWTKPSSGNLQQHLASFQKHHENRGKWATLLAITIW